MKKKLRLKIVETEKLKTEIRDLKEIMNLKEKLEKQNNKSPPVDKEIRTGNVKNNVHKKDILRAESFASKTSNSEREYNCHECCFQGTTQFELNKHTSLKHRNGNGIKCRICQEEFQEKWTFMKHRKDQHTESVAQCGNYMEGRCPYSDMFCWWSHANRVDNGIRCFICNETFQTKTDLMSHRKKKHVNLVRLCNQFQMNACRFQDEACWFKHTSEEENNDDKSKPKADDDEVMSNPVFQKVSEDLDPPIVGGKQNH